MKNILVTGGAGFIGSNLVRYLVNKYKNYNIINIDKLTYAGNLSNLNDIKHKQNYTFIECDICDYNFLLKIFIKYNINNVIHLAAESHVDRSISDPMIFAKTNIIGTINLLEVSKKCWSKNFENKLFYHISTDEVYGSLADNGFFTESTAYDPHSPYSASKASSDHFVRAYFDTYSLPIIISNCSNNYGPFQFPEKLIPLFIQNIIDNKPLPVYGNGLNVRDWLFVEDHVRAIDTILHKGSISETYNIGGFNEWKNIDLINLLVSITDKHLNRQKDSSKGLITYIKDRAGHDLRYAIDASKIKHNLGWEPLYNFEQGLELTVKWYLSNIDWLDSIKNRSS